MNESFSILKKKTDTKTHSERPSLSVPNIRHFVFRVSVFFIPNTCTIFIPNIRHFLLRSSVNFCSEHPLISVPNIWTTLVSDIGQTSLYSISDSGHPVICPDVRKSGDEKGQSHFFQCICQGYIRGAKFGLYRLVYLSKKQSCIYK